MIKDNLFPRQTARPSTPTLKAILVGQIVPIVGAPGLGARWPRSRLHPGRCGAHGPQDPHQTQLRPLSAHGPDASRNGQAFS